MKKFAKFLMAVILVFSLCITASMPAFAARPGTEFLSELHLAEAKDEATAKEMLTSQGYKVFNKNLNPGSSKVVYLGYKTSTDVEDAITDISVMNMNGGFNITDYESMLEESFDEYREMIKHFRIAANEFAANYKAGKKEAVLAYRQLNYYYVEKNGQKVKMGDYMLAFPENDDDFADILMKGNVNVLGNIRSLLAMGTGSSEKTLAEKVASITNDEQVYEKLEYHDDAKTIYNTVLSVEKELTALENHIEELKADETLTEEEKETFTQSAKLSATRLIGFKSIFDSLAFKDTTYGEYFEEHPEPLTDYSILYPIVEAMSEGQRALIGFGQIVSLFVFDRIEESEIDLEEQLKEIEEENLEIDVYLGTDMGLFSGSFAVTDETLRNEAATGESWTNTLSVDEIAHKLTVRTLIGVGGLLSITVSATILKTTVEMSTKYNNLVNQVATLKDNYEMSKKIYDAYQSTYAAVQNKVVDTTTAAGIAEAKRIANLKASFAKEYDIMSLAKSEYTQAQTSLSNLQPQSLTSGVVIGSAIGMAVGVLLIAYSAYSIHDIVSSYKVEYTDIPANIVDCVDTENGDRYIRYSVVNSYYEKDDQIKTRAGDLNAYNGEQWNAIYYTKSYEAGKCMLASADWPTNESDFGKYAPVHAFGKDVCYDLNKYSKNDDAESVFLAFRTSNAQKAAAAAVPDVVGSVLNYGLIAISGVVGIGIGMGLMGVIKRKKKVES